jgi:hypothetical protein
MKLRQSNYTVQSYTRPVVTLLEGFPSNRLPVIAADRIISIVASTLAGIETSGRGFSVIARRCGGNNPLVETEESA